MQIATKPQRVQDDHKSRNVPMYLESILLSADIYKKQKFETHLG